MLNHRTEDRRIKGLRLPGDPLNGLDRDEVRELFARGEGLDPRKLTIFKDNESLMETIRNRRVYIPTDGGSALDDALIKLSQIMEEEAATRRTTAAESTEAVPVPQGPRMPEDDRRKTGKVPLWKRIIKPDAAGVPESQSVPEPEAEVTYPETEESIYPGAEKSVYPASVRGEAIESDREIEFDESKRHRFHTGSIERVDRTGRTRPLETIYSGSEETAVELESNEPQGTRLDLEQDQSSDGRTAEMDIAGVRSQDTSRIRTQDTGQIRAQDTGRVGAEDTGQIRAKDSTRFSTREIARIYTDDRVEGQRPAIRRIQATRDESQEDNFSGVEEGTTVFLSLAASQSDSISGTVTAPIAEPAVTMATSRLPKITSDRLRQTGSKPKIQSTSTDGEEIQSLTDRNKDKGSRLDHLTKSTLILIVGLILSKLTGQMRQVLYPHVFVEKHLTDAYVQGFLIPDFIYELLVGGSIQAAIVPTLASALGTKDERKTWHSVSVFISFVSALMLFTLVLAEIFTPQLLAPFVKPENLELTSRMARVLFPQTFFMMGAALSIGIINAYSNFLKTSFGPAIYNSLFAVSLLILGTSSEQGLIHVGIGVSLSALAYFLFQIFLGRKEIAPFRFRLNIQDRGFRKLLLLAVPILFSSSIAHLNTMVLHGFTKTMEAGAATALNQANSVWLLPYGVFTVAIGQAMLPTLSTLIGREREEAASSLLSASIRRMLFFAIPSAITFFILREDLMMGIFIWRFDGYDAQIEVTRLAARLLQWYCVSIIVQGFIYLYNYAFYAMKVTYLPLINGILSLGLTLAVGSYITQPQVLGAEGLSVSYALAGTMTALILGVLFKLRFKDLAPKFLTRAWGSFFVKMIPMTAVMVSALYLMETFLSPAEIGGKLEQLLWLGLRFGVAFGIWFIGGKLLKLDLKIDPQVPKKSAS